MAYKVSPRRLAAPVTPTPPEGYEYRWLLVQTMLGDIQTNAMAREGWEPFLVGPSNSGSDFYLLFRRKKSGF